MDVNEQIRQLELEACLAVRSGNIDSAERIWQSIILHAKIQSEDGNEQNQSTVIYSLKNLLMFTVRSHNSALFESWLFPTWKIIRNLSFFDAIGDFVIGMAFVVGDQKLADCLPKLSIIFKQYIRMSETYKFSLGKFLQDWMDVAVQITSRGADEVSKELIKLLMYGLYFCKDFAIVRNIMWKYYMHMQGYVQHSGYEEAFVAYGAVHYLEIILGERYEKMPEGAEKAVAQRMLYCGIRDWQANVAKIMNMKETDIIRLWQTLVTQGKAAKTCQRFEKLLTKEMEYWRITRPDTYAKIVNLH